MSRPVDTRSRPAPSGTAVSIPASRAAGPDGRATSRGAPGGGFRTDIEGLRAVAVLLVVLGHAGVGGLAGGYVGVDVFFVISGFLITSLLLREALTTGRISIARFYARRAIRLLPASSLVLVATVAGAWLWLSPIRVPEFAVDALTAAFYVSNVRFAITGTDYLAAEASPSPVQHFWSLAVEEQFYLIWPLLLVVTIWLGSRAAIRHRLGERSLAVTTLALTVVVAGSFVLSLTETARSAPWAYFGAHTRAWQLGVGALLALSATRLRRLPGPAAAVLGWAGLAAICAAAVLYDKSTPFPGSAALLPVAGAAAVIAAGMAANTPGTAAHSRGAGTLLGLAPMQWVGRLSYGWYLWHWPVLMIGPAALGITASLPVNLSLCLAALVFAGITFRLVEDPVRHRRPLVAKPIRGIGVGIALSAAVSTVAAVAIAAPPSLPVGNRTANLVRALAAATDPEAELARFVELAERRKELPANLRPTQAEANVERPRVYDDDCHAEAPVRRTPGACEYGDPASERTVVLYGDSHAAHWFAAMELLAQRHGWRLVSLTKSACAPADLQVWHTSLKRAYTECDAWRAATQRRIVELAPELVIIGSTYAYLPAVRSGKDAESQWWSDGWDRTFTTLRSSGADVVTMLDTPRMTRNVPTCTAERPDRVQVCSTPPEEAIRGRAIRSALTQQAKQANVEVIDPLPWMCARTCPPIIGNVLVYRDAHHITNEFARALVPLLERRLPVLRDP